MRETRETSGLFLAEGVRSVLFAQSCGAQIAGLLYCRALLGRAARRVVRERSCPARATNEEELRALSIRDAPDGVLAVVEQRWASLPRRVAAADVWIALEHVRSPGNLGTLLRSASATGARGAIFLGDAVDPHDPRVVRATMGALFELSLIRASTETLRRWAIDRAVRVIGTSAEAVTDFRSPDYRHPHVLMLGSERRGLSKSQLAVCDALVSIPMERGDSLNVAVAGSLLLYEAYRHRARVKLDRPLARRHHPRR